MDDTKCKQVYKSATSLNIIIGGAHLKSFDIFLIFKTVIRLDVKQRGENE